MIPRRARIKRSPLPRGGRELQRSNVRQWDTDESRMIDSGGERGWLGVLRAEERDGKIRNLRLQVTHQLYVGAPRSAGKYALGVAVCSCQQRQGSPMPDGMQRVYSPRLDFQFEEKTTDSVFGWLLIYADAKSWDDPSSKQHLGYKLFAAIHGQPIRLYLPKGVIR